MGKGSRRERQAVDLYKRAGFAVYRPATVQYGENDIFGLFDLLAVHPDGDAVHAVQVKSNGARGIRKWERHTTLFRRFGWATVYLCPYDGEGWRWIRLCSGRTQDGRLVHTKIEFDERGKPVNMGEGLVPYLDPRRQP